MKPNRKTTIWIVAVSLIVAAVAVWLLLRKRKRTNKAAFDDASNEIKEIKPTSILAPVTPPADKEPYAKYGARLFTLNLIRGDETVAHTFNRRTRIEIIGQLKIEGVPSQGIFAHDVYSVRYSGANYFIEKNDVEFR